MEQSQITPLMKYVVEKMGSGTRAFALIDMNHDHKVEILMNGTVLDMVFCKEVLELRLHETLMGRVAPDEPQKPTLKPVR